MKNLENKLIASMRSIALDSINKAGGGHIGMAIGAASITYSIWAKMLKINEQDPKWINRDRFVLSAGHGSMSIYSIMHFLGLLSKEDMMQHKKLHSKTPSHPEIDTNDYIDATTGPLGQGIAMAVGMALSQKYLQNRYNKPGYDVFNHDVYVLHGDGCLQEGVALEAIQLAGTLGLDKLILIHDYNGVQIDSKSSEVNNIDFVKYFQSQNFNTFVVENDDPELIEKALEAAKKSSKPSYVQINTTIARYTPFAGTSKGHNGTLDAENTLKFKQIQGLTNTAPFDYDLEVYEYAQSFWEDKNAYYESWSNMFAAYSKQYPELASELSKVVSKSYEYDLSTIEFKESNVATRNYISPIVNFLEKNYPSVIGGSADLFAATKVGFGPSIADGGKTIRYGIREFAMAAINNGIYLDSGIKTIDSTFLAFADYMKPAIRLGALMEIPAIHVYTHDSYQVGGDGPTHQPFDQIPMLRAMSNVKVVRPCDESEMLGAFQYALNSQKDQVAIIGCRQNIPSFNKLTSGKFAPAYVIYSQPEGYDLSILASGSEVNLGIKVAEKLEKESSIKAQVISVPILQDLVTNDNLIAALGLNEKPMYAIEATSDSMWFRLGKYNKIDAHLASGYGYSEDGEKVYQIKGFEVDSLVSKIKEFLN